MHVVEAFYLGIDGVLAVVCAEKDCKLEKGREIAKRNEEVLRKMLEKLDLTERFKLTESSPRDQGNFDKTLKEFAKKISSMPKLERRITACTK